jgi:PIN domain nuclease of toxin-antitoxin system
VALGRLRLDEPFEVLLAAADFTELPLTLAHVARLPAVAPRHADPFDRALLAQAQLEQATFVSHDRALAPYAVPMLWT